MDAVKEPGVHTVVIMSSAQIGKSEILLNILGYFMHHEPSPILMVQPTLQMGESFSKDRVAPMLRDTPALRGQVKEPRSKDSANTLLHKKFPGGHLTICGANSPASLASRPIRVVLADEIDKYPASAGTEGDPLNLARKRTATFFNRKIILASTPTVSQASRIEMAFAESDQRRFFVPCPHCGHFQVLKWAGMSWKKNQDKKWDGAPPAYICEECGAAIDERNKPAMLLAGEWRGEHPCEGVAGFHINELYSPWRSWSEMVTDWYEAQRDSEMLRVFVNTSLGETFDTSGDSVNPDSVQERCERYPAEVPSGALCLVAGVDVQDDRLEATVLGLGKDQERWLIDHYILPGDPGGEKLWEALDDILFEGTWTHENGKDLRVAATCIDSGGHYTKRVYDYVRRRRPRLVFAIKGMAGFGREMVSSPRRKRSGRERRQVDLYPLGVDEIKTVIYARLGIDNPGPGYIHFPLSDAFDEEYFAQLTAESVRTTFTRGVPKREWVQNRPRNEALDCLVYAWAAQILLRPNYELLEKRMGVICRDGAEPGPEKIARPTRRRPARNSGFVNRWK